MEWLAEFKVHRSPHFLWFSFGRESVGGAWRGQAAPYGFTIRALHKDAEIQLAVTGPYASMTRTLCPQEEEKMANSFHLLGQLHPKR